MPSPEACADETDRELRAEIERLRACLRERDKMNLGFQAEIDRLRAENARLRVDLEWMRPNPGETVVLTHETNTKSREPKP